MQLTNTGVNLQYSSSFSWFRVNLIFSKFWNFVKGGGIGVFVKISILQKCPKFVILQYNELLIIICNVSEPGDVEFPIFREGFIFTKFWKNEFFWKKSRVVLVLEVSPMLLTNTRVNSQYPSSFSWFRVILIFSKLWNFVKGGVSAFLWKSRFYKNVPNS
jgi:hypothetical protein